ncbi:MAG: EutP/PduV family microcompartment system protein [Pseudoflavonifractor sp.]|nr:EutP/PduV family microcompartment system protein [Pseudoflavonifractor sp.]
MSMAGRIIMLMGPVSCGKTTLCQHMNGELIRYEKTQTIRVVGNTIDTPGEYLENRSLVHALIVTAADADLILFLQDATSEHCWFSPGQAGMFACPVIGVVTKTDLVRPVEVENAKKLLEYAGVQKIFAVSSIENTGIVELLSFLEQQI